MSKKNGLIPVFFCVPDITGFTKFMSTSDIRFTSEMIPAMLRKLIDANCLDMNIAEIEGDAIFFYKTGRLPPIKKVASQCKLFYKTFSDFIQSLEGADPENYERYLSDDQLGLKIVIHYGHIAISNIKGRTKLLGQDVIIVHKLLKNQVNEYNYILLTDKYLSKIRNRKALDDWFHWEELYPGSEVYEHIGEVPYHYITLDEMDYMSDLETLSKLRLRKKIS